MRTATWLYIRSRMNLYSMQEYQGNLLAHQAWLAKEVSGLDQCWLLPVKATHLFGQAYHSHDLISSWFT